MVGVRRDHHAHARHEVHDAPDGHLSLLPELEVPRDKSAQVAAGQVVISEWLLRHSFEASRTEGRGHRARNEEQISWCP